MFTLTLKTLLLSFLLGILSLPIYAQIKRDVVVIVMDSGVDLQNAKFKPFLFINKTEIPNNTLDDDLNGYIDDHIGYDAVQDFGSGQDFLGHGTEVASVIVGKSSKNFPDPIGLSNSFKIVPVRFLLQPTGNDTSDVLDALFYILNFQKSHPNTNVIVNASWYNKQHEAEVEEMVLKLAEAGILFIACAGNDRLATLAFPAGFAIDNIISVGASDQDKQHMYSNEKFQIAAQGTNIFLVSLHDVISYKCGTSYSTGLVSRSAAFLWAMNPSWDYRQVKKTIIETADHTPAVLKRVGSPVLNPAKTLLVDSLYSK
jgi:subtilisin family serine protease